MLHSTKQILVINKKIHSSIPPSYERRKRICANVKIFLLIAKFFGKKMMNYLYFSCLQCFKLERKQSVCCENDILEE